MPRIVRSRAVAWFAAAALASGLLAVAPAPAAALDAYGTAPEVDLQLNTNITVSGPDVLLGDIFSGYLSRPEKVVAPAPRPGQRLVLSAVWLSKLAHTYGLNWQPKSGYDRAVVYQPGQTVAPRDVVAAVKTALIANGMPANYNITPAVQVPSMTVDSAATVTVGVRESAFDAQNRTFSAVVEIPPGTPDAQFVTLRGTAYPVALVPVLKENAGKNAVITPEMLTLAELPENQIRPDTIMDSAMLVGKTVKVLLRPGAPVRETDVGQVTLVKVPVLKIDARRDAGIDETAVTFAMFDSANLPADVITEAEDIIGHAPRRTLSAGTPLRRGDVQAIREVEVPVAARDLDRGETLNAEDITWVTMNDAAVASSVLTLESDIVGRKAKHPIRAGQSLRGFDIVKPIAVERGKTVTILWSTPLMNLTVQGHALEAGAIGDVIQVANTKTKAAVMAEVVDAQTVRISSLQTVSR